MANIMTASNIHSKSSSQINSTVLVALGAVMLVALGLRLWALPFGMPYGYHMEEPLYSEASWDLACNTNLNSPLFQLHTYTFTAGIIGLRVFSPDLAVCSTSEMHTAPEVLMVARVVSAVYATATIGMVFALGRLLYSDIIGLLGAAMMSFNFLHVRESHHGTPDAAATFVITCTLVVYTLLMRNKTWHWYVLAGIFTALSVSARPTAVLLALPLLYAHLQARGTLSKLNFRELLKAAFARELWILAVTAAVAYFLMNPQSFVNTLDWLRYWRNFAVLGSNGGFGLLRVDELPASIFYLRAIEWGTGLPLALLMLAGLLWGLWKHQESDILLILFIIPYYLMASLAQIYFSRYSIPIMPMLSLMVARLVWDALGKRWGWAPVAAVIALALVIPAYRIVQYSTLRLTEDTRTEARAWIEANIPADAKIASEWHTSIPTNYSNVTFVGFYGLSDEGKHYEDYVEQGYEYVIVTSFVRDSILRDPALEANKLSVYEELSENATLVQEFLNYRGDTAPPYYIDQVLGPITDLDFYTQPGPDIWIYRLS